MKNINYEKIANKHKAKETRLKNSIIAFISGGLMGLLAELIIEVLNSNKEELFNQIDKMAKNPKPIRALKSMLRK